jgi:hypothetical protein
MAIDFGSSNPSRYYTVPDHADFTLPDSDWTWIALVEFNGSTSAGNYVVSTGDWGAPNSLNLYVYGITAGAAIKVASLPEVWLTTEPLVAGKPYWVYAVRRSGVLRSGQIAVGGSSPSESASVAITGSLNSGTGPYIANRAAGLVRPWNGRMSQIAFVSGAGITVDQVVELARGAPLLSMPFAPQIKALWHGRTSSNAAIIDLIGGKVATKQGTGYGTNEEDAQTPYIWTPASTKGVSVDGGSSDIAGVGQISSAEALGSPALSAGITSSGVASSEALGSCLAPQCGGAG